MVNFNTFNLHANVLAGVKSLGYTTPTPIQLEAIPPVLQGRDVIGLAQTGTGKTAAFVLPLLHRLVNCPRGRIHALIISPTRELAEQTCQIINELGFKTGLRSVAVYGGVSMDRQVRAIIKGAEIIVACPGRLLDHLGKGTVNLSRVEILVIDEADRMFDMGFLPDIRRVLRSMPNPRQTLLFSATMPDDIRELTREVLKNPLTVQVGESVPATTVSHALYPVEQHCKTALLLELLKRTKMDSVLVFTRTKHRAVTVMEKLKKAGYCVASLQGNLGQSRRQEALDGFRKGDYKILVATDIAARGLDVLSISHVINYDMPESTDAYTHRIGRTGRINHTGEAFTFVTGEDALLIRALERIFKSPLERRIMSGFDYTAQDMNRPSATQRPQRDTRRLIPAMLLTGGR
jgi:ATP-dependent RNA helicase RhlE